MLETGEHKAPSLNQISWLVDFLKKNEGINKHWEITWSGLNKISGGQYYWIKRYIAQGEMTKVNQILNTLKVPRKDEERIEEAKMDLEDRRKEKQID